MKVPRISGFEAAKAFSRAGYALDRQKGSHMILECAGRLSLSVPNHPELDRGTLRKLIQRAELTVEEFLGFL